LRLAPFSPRAGDGVAVVPSDALEFWPLDFLDDGHRGRGKRKAAVRIVGNSLRRQGAPEGHLVDFHLEHGLRLHTDPEYKQLYGWAINEIDAQGRKIGDDQIPWVWTLNFTATSCVLGDSIDIEPQFQTEETTPAPPKITQRQVIRLQLRPGRPWDDEDETSFSMFGTNRTIKSFQLEIHSIADSTEQESCRAWGSFSKLDYRVYGGL
jgi:hypothetical protein